MKIVKSVSVLREIILKFKTSAIRLGESAGIVGFIPTMGYLHDGHESLMRTARNKCDFVVASIFVNPIQFNSLEDLDVYPRDSDRDLKLAKQCGVDVVFMPEVAEMYPRPVLTNVSVANITAIMCGATRPGHFDGVSTVVAKLFNIVQPDYAYFGMKDAQQVAVIEQMVFDLNMNVNIVRCPTVRERDNLAMSSRNVRLTDEERRQAVVLSQALDTASVEMQKQGMTFGQLATLVEKKIRSMPLAIPIYNEIAYYPSMNKIDRECLIVNAEQPFIVGLAVQFGKTRLIDNRIFDSKDFIPI